VEVIVNTMLIAFLAGGGTQQLAQVSARIHRRHGLDGVCLPVASADDYSGLRRA
jgi:hypothetical protein